MPVEAALLDVDGTLIDSNYQHALAWYRAFRRYGQFLVERFASVTNLVAVLPVDLLADKGGDASWSPPMPIERWTRHTGRTIPIDEVEPFHGAHELIVDLKERGLRVVLASSSPKDELEHYLDLLDAHELADAWTTEDDVESTKPAPDLVHAALKKAGTKSAVMIGDTRWDVEAAGRASVETVCVMTGGWSEQELRDAGALAVFDSVDELRKRLEEVGLIPQLAG